MEDFDKSCNLNRSFSLPSSIMRRVIVQEFINDSNNCGPLLRHFSCEEIYNDKSKYMKTTYFCTSPRDKKQLQFNQLKTSTPIRNEVNTSTHSKNLTPSTTKRPFETLQDLTNALPAIETQKKDLNTSNIKIVDTNYCKLQTEMSQDFAKRRRPGKRHINTKKTEVQSELKHLATKTEVQSELKHLATIKPSFCNFKLVLRIVFLIFFLITVYIYYIDDPFVFVNRSIQLKGIESDLKENLINQDDAFSIIVHTFKTMDKWPKRIKVLPFVGSTGVGKTFTTNILKKHFYPLIIFDVQPEQITDEKFKNNLISKLNSYSCNLIVIDDIKVKDLEDAISFIKELPNTKTILVIPIFNVQYTDNNLNHKINYNDYTIIEKVFDKTDLFHEVVLFHEINEVVARDWLYKQFDGEIKNKENKIKKVLENHDTKYLGFKGLKEKLKLVESL